MKFRFGILAGIATLTLTAAISAWGVTLAPHRPTEGYGVPPIFTASGSGNDSALNVGYSIQTICPSGFCLDANPGDPVNYAFFIQLEPTGGATSLPNNLLVTLTPSSGSFSPDFGTVGGIITCEASSVTFCTNGPANLDTLLDGLGITITQNANGSITFLIPQFPVGGLSDLTLEVSQMGTFGNSPDAPRVSFAIGSAAVPEPGSLVLMGSGLFGLLGGVRRRYGKSPLVRLTSSR